MMDRFLFEANTNLPQFHNANTGSSEPINEPINELLPLLLPKDRTEVLEYKDTAENTYRENFETSSELLSSKSPLKDCVLSVSLCEDAVEVGDKKRFKLLLMNGHSHLTTDVIDHKSLKESSRKLATNGSTIGGLESCFTDLSHHFLIHPI